MTVMKVKPNMERGAHGLDAGQALQVDRERIGDLVLDLLRAAARPVGKDDDLVLAQVGDGIDGMRGARTGPRRTGRGSRR